MGNPAIEISGLSKEYTIGKMKASTLRGLVDNYFNRESTTESFYALRDLDLRIDQGESVAIIGKNGAGKSTLLKVLSKITKPTTGTIKLYGRVSSLLEVGTGFHPELTGRENIYLNGSILGMKQREITSKLDQIIDFSGIEQFLDTPVKRYSSGMYVRLAFSVAAHLEPEILIVDEVLAVGDIDFQRKCLGKMNSVASEGRTVIFVSHNMDAVERLCHRGIVLDEGKMSFSGDIQEAISRYMGDHENIGTSASWPQNAPGDEVARLLEVKVESNPDAMEGTSFDIRQPVDVRFRFEVLKDRAVVHPSFHLKNDRQQVVFLSDGFQDEASNQCVFDRGVYESTCRIPANFLTEGRYYLNTALNSLDDLGLQFTDHAKVENAISFHIFDPMEGGSARGRYKGRYPGVVRPILSWSTQQTNSSSS